METPQAMVSSESGVVDNRQRNLFNIHNVSDNSVYVSVLASGHASVCAWVK